MKISTYGYPRLYKCKYGYILLDTRKDIQSLCRYLHQSIDIYINPYGHTPRCMVNGSPASPHWQLNSRSTLTPTRRQAPY